MDVFSCGYLEGFHVFKELGTSMSYVIHMACSSNIACMKCNYSCGNQVGSGRLNSLISQLASGHRTNAPLIEIFQQQKALGAANEFLIPLQRDWNLFVISASRSQSEASMARVAASLTLSLDWLSVCVSLLVAVCVVVCRSQVSWSCAAIPSPVLRD